MKVQISINDELLKRADNYAEANCLSRSGLISQSLIQYLNAQEMYSMLISMNSAFNRIAKTGNIDTETMEQIETVNSTLNVLLTGNLNK